LSFLPPGERIRAQLERFFEILVDIIISSEKLACAAD